MDTILLKRTAVISVVFSVAALLVIIFTSRYKVIVISEDTQTDLKQQIIKQQDTLEISHMLQFREDEVKTDYLCVPLPADCKADDIAIENHYMDKEIYVMIDKAKESFYQQNYISGNHREIKNGYYESADNGIHLVFELSDIYEYEAILENGQLFINLKKPHELYDKIVVIDPACGGMNTGCSTEELQEKTISLQIARMLRDKLEDSGIKAYYTRMEDVNPSEDKRIALANEIHADMFIRIEVDQKQDTSVYGVTTIYNDEYFIPGFGSVELGDLLEKEVVTGIKGKALGLVKADTTDYAIRNATIPAAMIRVGCISNKQEAILLSREEYLDKIATGIYTAIQKSYDYNHK